MQDFKKMFGRITRSVIFLAGLLLIFLVLSRKVTNLAKRDTNLVQSRNKSIAGIQKEPEGTIDMIVLGDSESYTSVSPMRLWLDQGITSYICGKSGQKIQETYYMLETALQTQKPKLVMLETNVLFRVQTDFKGMQEEVAQKADSMFPIFRFHDVWKPLLLGNKYVEERYKGFTLRDTVMSYEGGEYMKETMEKTKIADNIDRYMEKIVALCREHGATLMLFSAPSPINYNFQKHNTLSDYAEKYALDYLDLNLKTIELGIDWKLDSLDRGDHLNLSGADKVSRYLGGYLERQYALEDHRQDEKYLGWEKEAKQYEGKVQKKIDVMKLKMKEAA